MIVIPNDGRNVEPAITVRHQQNRIKHILIKHNIAWTHTDRHSILLFTFFHTIYVSFFKLVFNSEIFP